MSRLQKQVDLGTLNGDPLTPIVYELTVQQIISLIGDAPSGENNQTKDFLKFLEANLLKFTTLTMEQAKQLAPSDLKKVYDAFQEVNAVFFEVAREAGLIGLVSELKQAVVEDFSRLLVGSLRQVTAQLSSSMATPSSLTPSTST